MPQWPSRRFKNDCRLITIKLKSIGLRIFLLGCCWKRISGLTKLWAVMSVFSGLVGWVYRRKQILIGFCICWELILLGADTWVFFFFFVAVHFTFHLSFCKILQSRLYCLVEFGLKSMILQYFILWYFSQVLGFSLVSSFIVLLFSYCIFCFLISSFCWLLR